RDDVWIARVVLRDDERALLACCEDAFDTPARITFENRSIFGDCSGTRGIANGIQVRIARTSADRVDLFARKLEGNADLDERLGEAHTGDDAFLQGLGNLLRTSRRDCRRLPAERAAEIDESARRQ